ncbi:MAG: hypothetical protein HQK83_04650 [Fibrobacteria bacterium]|nr:hypothetical protein [Fibrobacteria bacterium]
MKILSVLICVLFFLACNTATENDDSTPPVEDVDVNWTLSLSLGNISNVSADTSVRAFTLGTFTGKVGNYVDSIFVDSLRLYGIHGFSHTVLLDSSGNFSFEGNSVFGYIEPPNAVTITPKAKDGYKLIPTSIKISVWP